MKKNTILYILFVLLLFCSCTEKIEQDDKNYFNNNSSQLLKSSTDLPWNLDVLFDANINSFDYLNVWYVNASGNSFFPVDYNACNNAATAVLQENLSIENHILKIRAKKDTAYGYNYDTLLWSHYKYSRGVLRTQTNNHYSYGYYEIDFKFDNSYGFGPNLFLRHEDADPLIEIDVFEFEAWNPSLIPCGYYYDLDGDWKHSSEETFGTTQITTSNFSSMPNFSTSFNKIGFEWTPHYMAWYVNNKLAKMVTETDGPIPNVPVDIVVDVNFPRDNVCPNASTPLNSYYEIKSLKYYTERPVNSLFLSTSNNNGTLSKIKDYIDWRTSWYIAVPGDFDSDNLTDLYLYDKLAGEAFYYNSKDGDPNTYRFLRTSWKNIVSGNFDNSGNSDLLFYDALNDQIFSMGTTSTFAGDWDIMVPCYYDNNSLTDILVYRKSDGLAKFYSVNQNGLTLLSTMSGWRKTWDIIVPGNFMTGSCCGFGESEYCFYDKTNNQIYINGIIIPQSPLYKWDYIVSGKFDSDNIDDILCYDRETGKANFYKVSSTGLTLLKTYADWRKTWNILVSGDFDGIGNADLFLYDN